MGRPHGRCQARLPDGHDAGGVGRDAGHRSAGKLGTRRVVEAPGGPVGGCRDDGAHHLGVTWIPDLASNEDEAWATVGDRREHRVLVSSVGERDARRLPGNAGRRCRARFTASLALGEPDSGRKGPLPRRRPEVRAKDDQCVAMGGDVECLAVKERGVGRQLLPGQPVRGHPDGGRHAATIRDVADGDELRARAEHIGHGAVSKGRHVPDPGEAPPRQLTGAVDPRSDEPAECGQQHDDDGGRPDGGQDSPGPGRFRRPVRGRDDRLPNAVRRVSARQAASEHPVRPDAGREGATSSALPQVGVELARFGSRRGKVEGHRGKPLEPSVIDHSTPSCSKRRRSSRRARQSRFLVAPSLRPSRDATSCPE